MKVRMFSTAVPKGRSILLEYELRLATALPYRERRSLTDRLFLSMHPQDNPAIGDVLNPTCAQRLAEFCGPLNIVVEPADPEADEQTLAGEGA